MERLTKRISGYVHGAEGRSNDNLIGNYCRGKFDTTACMEKLAEYEDAEESGLLVRLPVAVGQEIYTFNSNDELKEEKIELIYIEGDRIVFQAKRVSFCEEAIGEFVFLTREEAEKVLEEMKLG